LQLLFSLLAGAAALFTFNAYRHYQQKMRDLTQRLQANGHTVETPQGTIEYAETGEGVPVLISHGAAGGYDQGIAIAELFGTGVRTIAVSRFGYLNTPMPADPSPAAQADIYAALLDQLNIKRIAILGAS